MLKAQKEGEEKVEAAKKEAEGIIQELRQLRKAQLANVKDHELIEAKSRLEGAAPELVKKQKVNVKNTAPKQQLRAGDEVKVLTFGQKVNCLKK